MKANIPLIGAGSLVVAVGIGAAAFTANNTVPATNAGLGVSTTSGFTVQAVEYSTDVTPGTTTGVTPKVTAVNFQIKRDVQTAQPTTATTKVYVQLQSAPTVGSAWASCTTTAATAPWSNASCTLTAPSQMDLDDVVSLSVAAFDDLT